MERRSSEGCCVLEMVKNSYVNMLIGFVAILHWIVLEKLVGGRKVLIAFPLNLATHAFQHYGNPEGAYQTFIATVCIQYCVTSHMDHESGSGKSQIHC